MTEQEIFNRVYIHASKMNRLAKEAGLCRYKCVDGERCLIGSLIPSHVYDPSFEGKSVGVMIRQHSAVREYFADIGLLVSGDPARQKFLYSLQGCHDDAQTKADMMEMLRVFAEHHQLIVPTL